VKIDALIESLGRSSLGLLLITIHRGVPRIGVIRSSDAASCTVPIHRVGERVRPPTHSSPSYMLGCWIKMPLFPVLGRVPVFRSCGLPYHPRGRRSRFPKLRRVPLGGYVGPSEAQR
jgi:hypothetical protein